MLGVKKQKMRESVNVALEEFKKGNRNEKALYEVIRDVEGGNMDNVTEGLDQFTDLLCQLTYIPKALKILRIAEKENKGNIAIYEMIGRLAFIDEQFSLSILNNTKAAKAQETDPERVHNYSDIGLAYYRLGLLEGEQKHFTKAFHWCEEALKLNDKYANAMVNMGLIYKHQNKQAEAIKMFKAANDCDPKNVPAIVNIGIVEYEEFHHYEDAAVRFLDALEINPNDEEALCNLGLSLKRTPYVEPYAFLAFEESVAASPGNSVILTCYMMFLLEQKRMDQFEKVLVHAKIIMSSMEMETILKLQQEFKDAIGGDEGDMNMSEYSATTGTGKENPQLRSALKSVFEKRSQSKAATNNSAAMYDIQEEPETILLNDQTKVGGTPWGNLKQTGAMEEDYQ